MRLISLNCPSCGAPIQADAAEKHTVCPYCSTSIVVDDGEQHMQYDDAEQAGYAFEKGRQRAQAEQQTGYYTAAPQPIPKKRKTWLWVLGWILCFPIPLTILVVRSQKLPVAGKAVIIVVAWLVYFALAYYGEKTDSTKQASGSETTTAPAVSEAGMCAPSASWFAEYCG